MKIVTAYFISMIERHPALGYLGAGAPTAAGFWVLVEQLTKIGALLSIAVGLAVGIVTYRVQRRQERIGKLQEEKLLAERKAGGKQEVSSS